MNAAPPQRLAFLVRVVEKEAEHLQVTDSRLFVSPFDTSRAEALEDDIDFAEQVDAFVVRFGRLQDTIGDKLLPTVLTAMGEKTGPAIENLDKAERFGWVSSVDDWLTMRQLRNQMVHEYIEDKAILADALNAGHHFVAELLRTAENLIQAIRSHELL